MTERIVIASHNRGKIEEWSILLRRWPYTPVSAAELDIAAAEEAAPDYIGNATLKAVHTSRLSGLPAIGDDTGLEVDALAGMPGLRTAEWAHNLGGWTLAFEHLADRLNLRSGAEAHATLVCAVAFIEPGGRPRVAEARVRGVLGWPPTELPAPAAWFTPDAEAAMIQDGVLLHRRLAFEQIVSP